MRIGTLEDVCDDLNIKFWQIRSFMEKNSFDFSVSLLYHAYKTACEKKGIKQRYTIVHAIVWYEYMSQSEKQKFIQEMTVLFGKVVEAYKGDKKKAVTKPSGMNSNHSHSENLDGALKDGGKQQ